MSWRRCKWKWNITVHYWFSLHGTTDHGGIICICVCCSRRRRLRRRRRSARFLTNNLLFYDWSLCLQKNRFAPFFALLTNSSFSLSLSLSLVRSLFSFFLFSFAISVVVVALRSHSSPEREKEKRKIFVCRLLHNKQHAPIESEWRCCIGQHYSDLFTMNGWRETTANDRERESERKENVVHANVFWLVNTTRDEKISPNKSSLGKERERDVSREQVTNRNIYLYFFFFVFNSIKFYL